MNVVWSATSFGYYMISYYLKYIPGDIYTNVCLSSIAEIFSSFFSAELCRRVGNQKTLILSFLMSGIFSFIMIFVSEYRNMQDSIVMVILVILIKLGLSSSQNVTALITAEYFPVENSSSVFGFCNIAARFTTIMAPLVAELEGSMPMLVFCAVHLGSIMFIE
jgi:MFS-type transporter involved in bile tolerance (Atg22 family)